MFGWEGKGKEKIVFSVWEEKERKKKGKNGILVREGNGKDEMSFFRVGRKWEGNIEKNLKGGKWEGIHKFFIREGREKEGKKLGEVSEIFQKWAENW